MTNNLDTNSGRGLSATVSAIAALLRSDGALGRGDVAALRRMNPLYPESAFFKVEGLLLDELLPGEAAARVELETRWAAIVVGLAHLGPLHDPTRRLGFALVEADYSEIRFARLIRADADHLVDELPMLARFLSAKGVSVDWSAAGQLILSAGGRSEEAVRRHLARDYYGALARA
jgi:CRISPR system Cascade subunit CasB